MLLVVAADTDLQGSAKYLDPNRISSCSWIHSILRRLVLFVHLGRMSTERFWLFAVTAQESLLVV